MNRDVVTLSQILERIERIEGSGIDRERLLHNSWDQDAVLRNLEIIGEASKRLSATIRRSSSDVRWKEIAGFRDIAIHGYGRVDLERTWRVVERELPLLKRSIRKLLRESVSVNASSQ
jgi:uncharacterized protein with HEPN domain